MVPSALGLHSGELEAVGSVVGGVVARLRVGFNSNHRHMMVAKKVGFSVQEEEEMDDNFSINQKLEIKINALSSTVSFSLETLGQHRVLIGKLQDEVDYLRRHGESLQHQLDQREVGMESPIHAKDSGCSHRLEEKQKRSLSDLNIAVVSSDEEFLKKEMV
jgi:hypothetical protein